MGADRAKAHLRLRACAAHRRLLRPRGGTRPVGRADPFTVEYDDTAYVFGTAPPKNRVANRAGMDVSPALRDCLHFSGLNNDQNQVDWQFVDAAGVPSGPWTQIVTTSQVYWR